MSQEERDAPPAEQRAEQPAEQGAEETEQQFAIEEGWDPTVEVLYRRHFERLVASATRMLRNRALAEEAVQDAFVQYHTAQAQPAPGKEFAYLQSVALNNARSIIRRSQTGARKTEEQWRSDQHRFPVTPEDEVIAREADALIIQAMAALPERQREAIVLRYCATLSERQTAERMSISPGSVKQHAARGRVALQHLLTAGAGIAA